MECNTGKVINLSSLYASLQTLEDQRKAKGKRYTLTTVLMGILLAKLCGEDKPSYLNRWNQPDTDVPESQGVQAWDRYAYVNNSPINYNDPTGHSVNPPQCPFCNQTWFNYSNYSPTLQLVVDNIGTAGCLLLGCHVDYENNTIEGPSTEEYLQTQANSLVIGADVVLAPEAAAMQSAAKNAESALAKAADQYACGSFCVKDWSAYPEGVRQPAKDTVFRLINGDDYDVSRKMANNINKRIRGRLPKLLLDDLEVHEVIPVKFGGDPTDLGNKILVGANDLHIQLNEWWRTIQRAIER